MLRILSIVAFFASFAGAQSKPLQVHVDSPVNGAKVPYRPCVAGVSSDENAPVIPIVHALDVDTYWVQPRLTPAAGGIFVGKIYIAEPQRRRFEHQEFEIRFAVHPKQDLYNGRQLDYWPDAEVLSRLIRVTRSDDAPDGCKEPAEESKTPMSYRPAAAEPRPAPPQSPVVAAPPARRPGTWLKAFLQDPWLRIDLFFFFVLFALCPEKAQQFIGLLRNWCVGFWHFLVRFSRAAFANFTALFSWFRSGCSTAHKGIWEARGYRGTLRTFCVALLVLPVLLAVLLVATGTDIYVLHSRLSLILSPEVSRQSGLFASAPAGGQMVKDGQGQPEPPAPSSDGPLQRLAKSAWNLLRQEGLWFVAIGLAATQAVAGMFVLWNFTGVQPLETSPWKLLRIRTMPFIVFVVLELALTVLAGLGGAEYSPSGIGWALPAAVAAAIAFTLPWLATYTLHYAVETAANCLAPMAAILLVVAVSLGAALSLAAGATLLFVVVASLAATFVCACALGVPLAGFLWIAIIFGDAVRRVYRHISSEMGKWRERYVNQTRPVAAAAALVTVVSVVLYFIVSK